MGYGELALKEETDGMAEINLWDLIVVKLSELGILKRYYILYTVLYEFINERRKEEYSYSESIHTVHKSTRIL